jgi:hypothetical protein
MAGLKRNSVPSTVRVGGLKDDWSFYDQETLDQASIPELETEAAELEASMCEVCGGYGEGDCPGCGWGASKPQYQLPIIEAALRSKKKKGGR